jgi:tetratricopeptide (TPR) repeat protein
MKKPFLVSQKERWEYLISKGQLAGRNKDSVSAIEYFEAAYKVSRYFSKRDRIRQQSAYYLGYAKFATSDKTGAITYLEEFLKHPKSAEDSENEVADVHTELGACFYGSDNEKATEHFVKALQIKKRLGLSTLEIDVMLGSIKMMREDYAGAIPLYESAYQVQKKRMKMLLNN